ncbi:hypothetical protein FQA39_LY03106 [Lamprigera yunnana]|nr:hypothetical protein FQA39_LY03106 [Lamprigera yunnana]
MLVTEDPYLKLNNLKGKYVVNKVHDFFREDIFFKYVSYAPMVNIVENIVGSNITAFHSMLLKKPPNSKQELSRHQLHQDVCCFPFRPVDLIVTSWTAMEPAYKDNGYLFGIPGSHKRHLDDYSGVSEENNAITLMVLYKNI